jgi:hypothetical protein
VQPVTDEPNILDRAKARLAEAHAQPPDDDYPHTRTKCGASVRTIWETHRIYRTVDRVGRSACPKRGRHKT